MIRDLGLLEADSQLSNENIYEKIDYDPSSELFDKISKGVDQIKDRREMDGVS